MAKIARKLPKAEWQKLEEPIRALYTERGNEYVLDADDATELQNALQTKTEELRKARERIDALKDIDPEKHHELLEAAAKAERDKDLERGNYEKLLEQDRAAHQSELAKRDEGLTKLRNQLEESLVDGELTRAIATYPGARPKLLMPAARAKVALREIGGKLRSVIVDEKGEARLKPGAKAVDDYMTPADLIAEMRNDKEYAGGFPAASSIQQQQQRSVLQPESNAERSLVESIAQQVRDGSTVISS